VPSRPQPPATTGYPRPALFTIRDAGGSARLGSRRTGGGRLNTTALVAAQSAVEYARTELAADLAQLPDADGLTWRSDAQKRFGARLDELRHRMRDAATALDLTADALDVAIRAAAVAAAEAATASASGAPPGGGGAGSGAGSGSAGSGSTESSRG